MTVLGRAKEILGVDNAQVRSGTGNTPDLTQQAAYCQISSLPSRAGLNLYRAWFYI